MGVSLDDSSGEEKVVVFGFGPAKVGATTGDPAVQRTDNDRYIARVLADDGSFDPDFNDGEVFSYNSGGTFSDGGRRGLVLEDGSIVSAGYTNYGEGLGNHILVIKLTPEGTPDPSFGFGIASPGVARANPFLDDGGVAECYNVAVQSSGRYVTTGYGRATVANGQVEPRLGDDGQRRPDLGRPPARGQRGRYQLGQAGHLRGTERGLEPRQHGRPRSRSPRATR